MNPERESLERHIAEVKRSLAARLDELGGRVSRARRAMDVRGNVREHIGPVMGAAAAVGFLLGRRAVRNRPLLPGDVIMTPRPGIFGQLVTALVKSVATSVAAAVAAAIMKKADDQEDAAQTGLFRRDERVSPPNRPWA